MKRIIHTGEFLSHAGVTWRVDILRELPEEVAPGDLTFEASEALTIEWGNIEIDEVIHGSSATLQIESPGDRTYADLYTIKPGDIRMDVYREGELYWSGLLDPEFYEEPYERGSLYVVSLTFTDFGILDRLKYDLTGPQTLQALLSNALSRSGLNFVGIDADGYTSLYFDDDTRTTLGSLTIPSENFYDEDGKPSTLREAVEGVLKPLGMKMIQRAGRIYIYDLNGLHTQAPEREAVWDGSSSTMGTAKVYNNVQITFSPYANGGDLLPSFEWRESGGTEDATYTYKPFLTDALTQGLGIRDYGADDFKITVSPDKGTGLAEVSPEARYFRIEPMIGSVSDCSGVAWGFSHPDNPFSGSPETALLNLSTISHEPGQMVMRTKPVWLPYIPEEEHRGTGPWYQQFYLRLTLETLIDVRYNPFAEGSPTSEYLDNHTKDYEYFNKNSSFIFLPVAIVLKDAEGNELYHYDNHTLARYCGQGHLLYSQGSWVEGPHDPSDSWLAYYDKEDLEKSASSGWVTNRHCIGRWDHGYRLTKGGFKDTTGEGYSVEGGQYPTTHHIYDVFKKMDDGQYIPYPPAAGYIEIIVYSGIKGFTYREGKGNAGLYVTQDFEECYKWRGAESEFKDMIWFPPDGKNIYSKLRWVLYKAPELSLVKSSLVPDDLSTDDIEYSGYVNKDAEDDLSIDTICGTSDRENPLGRGIYIRTSTGEQVQQLKRAGITDHPERLLIGTIYTQGAERKTVLSGEAVLDPGGVCTYYERNQGNRKFWLTSETQDCIADTSEIEIREFEADEYVAIEEVEDE